MQLTSMSVQDCVFHSCAVIRTHCGLSASTLKTTIEDKIPVKGKMRSTLTVSVMSTFPQAVMHVIPSFSVNIPHYHVLLSAQPHRAGLTSPTYSSPHSILSISLSVENSPMRRQRVAETFLHSLTSACSLVRATGQADSTKPRPVLF